MKSVKIVISILLCVSCAFAFASCKKDGAEQGDTTTTTVQSETGDNTTNKNGEASSKPKTTVSTTTPMPSTKAKEAIPITQEEALERLKDFYGTAYTVKQTEIKKDILYLETYDLKNNLYSKIEVNLKTSDVKETIVHSDEVNEFNLMV